MFDYTANDVEFKIDLIVWKFVGKMTEIDNDACLK